MEILEGVIAAVVFQNYENGYAVLRLDLGGKEHVTVVGTVPQPIPGERLMVTGKWTTHPSFGRQFEAEFLERLLPQTEAEILRYLAGGIVKGVGPKMAGRIVAHFGAETLTVMEQEPDRLAEVPGISQSRAAAISEEFRVRVGMRRLLEFFTQHLLPPELAVRVYRRHGENAIEELYDDPYLLMEPGLEAPFGPVDRFAIELGVAADDPRRVRAGLQFELQYNLLSGHSFLPWDKLCAATAQLLGVDLALVEHCAEQMEESGRLVTDRLLDLRAVYLPELYEAECYVRDRLLSAAEQIIPEPPKLEKRISEIAQDSRMEYSPQQDLALRQAAVSGVLLITGGPGTGKTTILQGILELFGKLQLRCVLAAPTGRAAKRLTEVTGEEASTIHRLLEAGIDPGTGEMVFTRNEGNPLKADAVIVDEMSMVDLPLLDSLLRAVSPRKRLILVGDPDQLPPVGPGFPFGDLLRSGKIPAVRLTEVFRQAKKSKIVTNAHRINQGLLPEITNRDTDFFFLPCTSEEALVKTVTDLCKTRLPQNMHIPTEQIQVLSPTRKGNFGTAALNRALQAALNPPGPGKKERTFGEVCFREGDRVMQIRNNYDLPWKKTDGSALGTGVFNGDVGTVTAIDLQAQTLTAVFDDREAIYDFGDLGELEPAYAVTVHKSQGSEYRAVVLCLWGGHPNLLSRSVLYTAVTRARELLVIVGRREVIAAMTENAKRSRRYSGLKLRLQGGGK